MQNTGTAVYEAYRKTEVNFYWLRCDADDSLTFIVLLPEDWDGEDIELHAHVLPAAKEPGVIVFDGLCHWASTETDKTALTSAFRANTSVLADELDPTQKTVHLGVFTPPREGLHRRPFGLDVWLRRPAASNPEDTYKGTKTDGTPSANVAIFDVHAIFRPRPREVPDEGRKDTG